jgi:excisionase family DNA binding protein
MGEPMATTRTESSPVREALAGSEPSSGQVDSATSSAASFPPASSFANTDDLPLALTIWETSAMLRLDPRTIRAMVTSGELDGNRRGHAIRVSRASVLEWLCGKRRVPRSRR